MPNRAKEKLVELLNEATEILLEMAGGLNDNHGNGIRADRLIANGVTVQSEIDAKTFQLMRECERLKEQNERLGNAVNVLEEINSDLCKQIKGVTVQEWISVKDRLPKGGAIVLCNTDYFVEVLQWDERADMWVDQYRSYRKNYVTHWMPLPEPPKGLSNG